MPDLVSDSLEQARTRLTDIVQNVGSEVYAIYEFVGNQIAEAVRVASSPREVATRAIGNEVRHTLGARPLSEEAQEKERQLASLILRNDLQGIQRFLEANRRERDLPAILNDLSHRFEDNGFMLAWNPRTEELVLLAAGIQRVNEPDERAVGIGINGAHTLRWGNNGQLERSDRPAAPLLERFSERLSNNIVARQRDVSELINFIDFAVAVQQPERRTVQERADLNSAREIATAMLGGRTADVARMVRGFDREQLHRVTRWLQQIFADSELGISVQAENNGAFAYGFPATNVVDGYCIKIDRTSIEAVRCNSAAVQGLVRPAVYRPLPEFNTPTARIEVEEAVTRVIRRALERRAAHRL